MISREKFNKIIERQKMYKYSSMNYIEYEDCEKSDILYDSDDLILLQDKSKSPSMLYFATNDFENLVKIIADFHGKMRLHFIPREYAAQLKKLGFIEWGEYVDFFNYNLAKTAASIGKKEGTEYLQLSGCEEVSKISLKCRLQSRGFEGETQEWFEDWLAENKVIIVRKDSAIAGFCCVSIYNNGMNLWIREIAVAPEFQSMGFGKQLMELSIQYGAEQGAVKGFLAADILNKNAIKLYKKYGFRQKDSCGELQMVK